VTVEALWGRVDELAADVGRLRRTLNAEQGTSLAWTLNRLAGHVESLDLMLRPSAGDLVRCGASPDTALDVVDGRVSRLRSLLGTRS